jgi:1-acyl-sn-glycerol-3-phosphate acyltransferase
MAVAPPSFFRCRMQRIKADAYTAWCWFAVSICTAWWSLLSILASVFSRTGKLQHLCMRRWSRASLWLSRTSVEIEGLENIDRDHPQIFVANHNSLHDVLLLSAYLPVQFRWIAKKSIFNIPFMGWHMSRAGYVPIDRDNPRQAAKSIIEAASIIGQGNNVVAFPEGTRSATGDLGNFQSGVFALALRAGVAVVPISIDGSDRVIMAKTLKVNPGVVIRIKIDRPIAPGAYSRSDKRALMEKVWRVMKLNLLELRARRRPNEQRTDAVFRWIYGKKATDRA